MIEQKNPVEDKNGIIYYAVTKYEYDEFDRLLTSTDALGQTESNTYDYYSGNLKTSTDRNGQNFNYTYDGLNNLKTKALSDETNIETKTYGMTGKITSAQNAAATINYTYNDKGLPISETDTAAGTVKSFTYDSDGNRLTFMLTRNGQTEISQSYAYDKLNRLISVSENGNVIAQYSYDNKGNRTQTVSGGETTNYTYNIANLLTSQTTGDKLNEQYTYYLNGNQKNKTSNGTLTTYEYDGMNRLSKENDTEYSFDDFGNRKTMTSDSSTVSYTYDLNNRLTKSVEKTGNETRTTTMFYDKNGNQISKAVITNKPLGENVTGDYIVSQNSDKNVALYEYNCYNQLVGVHSNGKISSYTYAPDGMRASKTADGNTINFVYDNANIVEEITADEVNKYFRGLEIIKNDEEMYYFYNGQGDVSMLADNAGNTAASYIFDAYGNQSEENTVYNPFGYRGEYTDAESGLVYLRARMYDSETGRFMSEDPAKDGLNWYVYGNQNPTMFIDPSGLRSWQEASEIIQRNSNGIKNAGAYYNVNPAIIASCIYTEQTMNVNWVDDLTDVLMFFADTSIGIGQVRVSTAKLLEDSGYIAKTEYLSSTSNYWTTIVTWSVPGYSDGTVVADSREEAIAHRLTSESENVNYVAAYLAYWQDRWRNAYPDIDGHSDILGTLYNLGKNANAPNGNPRPNDFGVQVKKEYFYMKDLLGI